MHVIGLWALREVICKSWNIFYHTSKLITHPVCPANYFQYFLCCVQNSLRRLIAWDVFFFLKRFVFFTQRHFRMTLYRLLCSETWYLGIITLSERYTSSKPLRGGGREVEKKTRSQVACQKEWRGVPSKQDEESRFCFPPPPGRRASPPQWGAETWTVLSESLCGFQRLMLLVCNNYVITTIRSITTGLLCVACLPNSGCCCQHTRTHMPVTSHQQLWMLCGMNTTVPSAVHCHRTDHTTRFSFKRQKAPEDRRQCSVRVAKGVRCDVTGLTSVSLAATMLKHVSKERHRS